MSPVLCSLAVLAGVQLSCPVPSGPDPKLTPGDVATTDRSIICGRVNGKTFEKRTRIYETEGSRAYYQLAQQVFQLYGVPFSLHREYQLDDLCPISIGCRQSMKNNWPQLLTGRCNAIEKDALDRYAWKRVCHYGDDPAKIQAHFLAPADWRTYYSQVYGHGC